MREDWMKPVNNIRCPFLLFHFLIKERVGSLKTSTKDGLVASFMAPSAASLLLRADIRDLERTQASVDRNNFQVEQGMRNSHTV